MDAHVQLVALLRVKAGIAAFVAEDVVVDTIGTQFLGDRHAEALARIGLEHPVAYGIVDACRPGETGKATIDVGRALLIDRTAFASRREEPVVITANMRVGMIQTNAGIQLQAVVDSISVHGVGTQAGRLEVGDDKAPAAPSVVLILTIQTGAQFMALAKIQRQTQIGCQRILHEAALQRAVGFGHITMTNGFAQLLAMVVLPGKVGFHAQTVALPRGMAEHLQVVDPLVGQVYVAA